MFNYLYILINTNNIDLIWRDNVFDHVNRNIQYITMSVFTCTEYLKSKTTFKTSVYRMKFRFVRQTCRDS